MKKITFSVYPISEGFSEEMSKSHMAEAMISRKGEVSSVKLLFKTARGQYYSALNDAGKIAESLAAKTK